MNEWHASPVSITTCAQRWTGHLVTAIPVLFLLIDSCIKFVHVAPGDPTMFARLGIPDRLA